MTLNTAKTTSAATTLLKGDMLITLGSTAGGEVEMTRANKLQLEREMAATLKNPLAALMVQVAIEYREMSASPARTELVFA